MQIKTIVIKKVMMIILVGILLTSCGTKPAIIQMQDTKESPTMTPETNETGEVKIPTEEKSLAKIFVHVCGAVNSPGVYEMLEDNRIFEAIELADGFTDEAYAQAVNLADKVVDGQQVIVPTKEEAKLLPQPTNGGISVEQSLININTAEVAILQELNGIGESKAKAIVSHREKNGLFNNIEDIKNVSGIGEKLYEKIKENITVD